MKDGPTVGVTTPEGPRRPEGHRSGLGSFQRGRGRDGRGGGKGGRGRPGGRRRRVPGYPWVQGAGTVPAGEGARHAPSTAGRGGEKQVTTAHARCPTPLTITCEPPGAVAFFFLAEPPPVPGLAGRFLLRGAAPAGDEAAAGTRLAMPPDRKSVV